MGEFVGVDIGGSHITVATVNALSGIINEQSRVRLEVDSSMSKDCILGAWTTAIASASKHLVAQQLKIGVAMPGPFDYEGGISLIHEQEKFRSLYKVNVGNELAERLSIDAASIKFINDAAAFAKGEATFGVAKNKGTALALTFGTGLGSSRVNNGLATALSLWCLPFKNGIAEDYLSTRWFVLQAQERLGLKVNGLRELLDAGADETVISAIFDQFSKNLVKFLVLALQGHKVDAVVLGGSIAKAYPFFEGSLRYYLAVENLDLPTYLSQLEEDAALIGAASLFV